MEEVGRSIAQKTTSDTPPTIVAGSEAQVLSDEEAARKARELYRESGIPALEPDDTVAPHLGSNEQVLGSRRMATVARIEDTTLSAVRQEGPLYVTNLRLLHLGPRLTSVPLVEIAELAMADDRILVTISGARGVMVDVDEPRQLRVLLAAARARCAAEVS